MVEYNPNDNLTNFVAELHLDLIGKQMTKEERQWLDEAAPRRLNKTMVKWRGVKVYKRMKRRYKRRKIKFHKL